MMICFNSIVVHNDDTCTDRFSHVFVLEARASFASFDTWFAAHPNKRAEHQERHRCRQLPETLVADKVASLLCQTEYHDSGLDWE